MPGEGFTGPACSDLVEFMKSIKDIPAKHKGTLEDLSKKTIEMISDIDALHVWESSDDAEDLLQLTQVYVKLKMEAAKQEGRRRKNPAMIIIASENGMSYRVIACIKKAYNIQQPQKPAVPDTVESATS